MEEETKVIEKTQEKSDIEKKELGLKWFKFLIYFALWVGAILNFCNGIRYLTGNIYLSQNLTPNKVYRTFPELKGLDGFIGVVSCCLGVFQIITRFCLAKYKKYSPAMLYGMYVIMMIINLIYGTSASSIMETNMSGEIVGEIVGSLIVLIINVVYFKNRKHLFIN